MKETKKKIVEFLPIQRIRNRIFKKLTIFETEILQIF